MPDNINILYKIKVEYPIPVEDCIKSLIYGQRYRNRKEYAIISVENMIINIKKCLQFTGIKILEEYDNEYESNIIQKDELERARIIDYYDYYILIQHPLTGGGQSSDIHNQQKHIRHKIKHYNETFLLD